MIDFLRDMPLGMHLLLGGLLVLTLVVTALFLIGAPPLAVMATGQLGTISWMLIIWLLILAKKV